MKIYNKEISFLEVPDEINLTFFVHGCKLACYNCFWKSDMKHYELTINDYKELLNKYKNKVTCITFLGGEWDTNIIEYLKLAKHDYKTCLYTGLNYNEFINKHKDIIEHLDYLKVGRYIEELGALDSKTTNQQLIYLIDNKIIKGKGCIYV